MSEPTPAERRAQLLGLAAIGELAELAANAPPLSDAQRDIIRAAMSS